MNGRTLLVPRGEFAHPAGRQVLDGAALERILNAARATGRDIPVDYDHGTFFDKDAPLAGSVAPSTLSIGPGGLYGEVAFNARAAEEIRAGGWRCLSPALLHNPNHSTNGALHVERLAGLGLTNRPNIPDMEALTNNPLLKEETMQELLAQLKSALGLAPETDDAEALKAALEKLEELSEPDDNPEEEAAEGGPDAGENTAADQNPGPPTREEFQALKDELAQLRQRDAEERISAAIADGKLLPVQRDWAANYAGADPEGFRQFLANSRPAVNMGAVVPGAARRAAAQLDPDQERVNRLLGIERGVFDKYNKQS